MGRVPLLLVCLALAAPACAEAGGPSRPRAETEPRPAAARFGRWVPFTHPEQPWSWRHPRDWHLRTFDTEVGLATHEGAILSNVPHRLEYPDLGSGEQTSAWDFRRVPSHAVVIELSQVVRLMHVCPKTAETPLSLGDSEVVPGAYGSPPRRWQSLCVRGQSNFGLNVWLGDDAPAKDRAAARKVVRSIRFREPLTTVTCDDEAATDLSREPDYPDDHRQRWQTADGCDVRLDLAMTRMSGCYDGETAGLLLGWPFGSSSEDDLRVFVRDPHNVFGDDATSAAFRDDIELPPDARDTFLRQYGSPQLWIVPGDDAFVYLVYLDRIQRWPLDETPPECD